MPKKTAAKRLRPQLDELLTVQEVAEQLRLADQTVRNWIDRNELPAVRVGARRVRIRRAELDAFLVGREARQEAGPPTMIALRAEIDELRGRVEALERASKKAE